MCLSNNLNFPVIIDGQLASIDTSLCYALDHVIACSDTELILRQWIVLKLYVIH
jgi:hypothetical protein